MAVERPDRGEHQRPLGEIAGVVDQIARGEIVGAVGDDIEAAQNFERVLRDKPGRIEPRLRHAG